MEILSIVLLAAVLVLVGLLLVKFLSESREQKRQLALLQEALEHANENRQTQQEEQLERLSLQLRQQGQEQITQTQQAVVGAVGTMSQGITGSVSALSGSLGEHVKAMSGELKGGMESMNTSLRQSQSAAAQLQGEKLESIDRHLTAQQEAMLRTVETKMKDMEQRIIHLDQMSEQKLEALRSGMQSSMQEMRKENAKKLEEIRGTVDEKLQDTLQKKIADSFQTVSQQLEQVYKGLGEMQHLATDVGGLKQVLSGVKTRGILGEIQLGAILEEILSPEQYETNVATIPGSRERVEFAVRLPGADGGRVYLPIDSKFPGDSYMHLQEATATGEGIPEARKALETVLKKSAKDIRDKYVEPPYTTTFGILFLPFEGLYAEVVNMGMIEVLQRDYNINVAGPSTMAALLNSLQMGFRTLAIQKRSNEVWQVLGAVKTEFSKFEEVMEKMQSHLQQTSKDLDTLMGTRTRAINRKLRDIQQLEEPETRKLLETDME